MLANNFVTINEFVSKHAANVIGGKEEVIIANTMEKFFVLHFCKSTLLIGRSRSTKTSIMIKGPNITDNCYIRWI